MSDFDAHARTYADSIDASITSSGYTSEHFAADKAKYAARTLSPSSPRKILDFGCGVGLLSGALSRQFPSSILHGYDVSSESVKVAADSVPAADVFTADEGSLDSDYDLVVVANVMHHVSLDDRQRTISTIARLVVSGGSVIVFEHNPYNPLTRRAVDKCPFDDDAVLLRAREVVGYLGGAGLTVLRRDYIVFFPKPLERLRTMEPWLGWCPLGAQYAVVGRRG